MATARMKRGKVREGKATRSRRKLTGVKGRKGSGRARHSKTASVHPVWRFDLVLRNGRVVDPANGLDARMDVAVKDGKIAALEQSISSQKAKSVRDVTGLLVLPGLVDTHGHIYEYVSGDFGLNADDVGV